MSRHHPLGSTTGRSNHHQFQIARRMLGKSHTRDRTFNPFLHNHSPIALPFVQRGSHITERFGQIVCGHTGATTERARLRLVFLIFLHA